MSEKKPNPLYPQHNSGIYQDIIDYTKKIESDKTDYRNWGLRGAAYYEIDFFDLAISDLTQALELKRDYAMGYYNRGRCYYKMGDYKQAIVEFANAKIIDSSLVVNKYHLGLYYDWIDDNDKAIELYSSYLLENSGDKAVLERRASLYYHSKQNEKGVRDIAELLSTEIDEIEKIESLNSAKKSDGINIATLNKPLEFSDIGFVKLKDENCSGVYILEFGNNEYYIGQAKRIQTIIKQHHKKYSDIRAVYFKAVDKDSLLLEETKTINIFEVNSLRILNLEQINFVNIFDEASQQRWINELDYNKITGQKVDSEAVRKRFRGNFSILKEKPYYEEMIQILATYIEATIPNYLATEYNYWTLSCTPTHSVGIGNVCKVCINEMPVLNVYYTAKRKTLTFMINVSKLPYLKYIKQNGYESLVSQLTPYKLYLNDLHDQKTEEDVVKHIVDIEDFKAALSNPLVLSSMRLFNLRMMNNVGEKIVHKRRPIHCMDLTDAIINLLD